MKLCILDDAYEESSSELADVDVPAAIEHYFAAYDYEHHLLTKRTAVQRVIELTRADFEVFVNLCDGAWDEDRPGIEVVQALERLNVPFTGAGSAFYEPSREAMKRVAHYADVPTPAGFLASTCHEFERAAATLRFPLITKHPSSYSSIGMTRRSRVETPEDLEVEARRMIDRFGSVLIEEFVEGREFTVLVAENPDDPNDPVVYEPVEFEFPEGESFKHFDLKWKDYAEMTCVRCTDEAVSRRLKDLSARFFVGINGTGYARCDLRMRGDGAVFMLEINPNCGVFYPPEAMGSADYALAADPNGHDRFIDTILRAARNRVGPTRAWTIAFDRDRGYGMYAVRPIPKGSIIAAFEEQSHVLVSRSRVDACWSDRDRRWFERYAYPVSDDVFVMWSRDPEAWKPINHSCDPNAWLHGLDVAARRPIEAGEEITIDYATFCAETMPNFDCTCGTKDCRGEITGTDFLKPFVARYGDHVSDYVRRRRTEHAESG